MLKQILPIAFLLVFPALGTAQPTPRPPLPLDPITRQETGEAQRIALADAKLRETLGTEPRLVYALSIAPKLRPEDDEPRGRHADLLYIRTDNQAGVRVLVDLVGKRVVQFERVVASSVPLGRNDVAEALRIATADAGAQKLVGARLQEFRVLEGPLTRETANGNYVEGLRHTGAGPEDPCSRHRCVYLIFNSGGRMLHRDQQIVVDLNDRRVRISQQTEPQHGGH